MNTRLANLDLTKATASPSHADLDLHFASNCPDARAAKPRKSRQAFTLIEMLVVVSIIALLIAMLLPALGKARRSSQLTVCQTRQRVMGNALTNYSSAQRGYYPTYRNAAGNFADAYDLRRGHPYSGSTDRPALGFGLLVSTGFLPDSGLGEIIHCPTFDNTRGRYPGHCDDVKSSWAYGGSGYLQYPGHRIIGSYTYRGTSYQVAQVSGGRPPRAKIATSNFVMLIDVADMRFRLPKGANNAHGGYNRAFGDGSVSHFADETFMIDTMVQGGGGTMNGRHNARNDEVIYNFLGNEP